MKHIKDSHQVGHCTGRGGVVCGFESKFFFFFFFFFFFNYRIANGPYVWV